MPESRVCFVVTELLGLVRNGGIATATSHAALVLSRQGYEVDLFYCGHTPEIEEHWAKRYVEAEVSVRWLDRSAYVHPPFLADSYRLYHQLKERAYDVIVFQDWQGLGYCSVLAKRAGLAFEDTRLIHIVHGPDEWLREANRQLEVDAHELGSAHLERRSAELADAVVGPSRHLLDWMANAGWQLPADQSVIPYFTEAHTTDLHHVAGSREEVAGELTELVFFGRLEERKGVRVLTGALNRLGPEILAGLQVSFLGRPASFTPEQVTELITPEVRAALKPLAFHGAFDQAQAVSYLRQPGRLALIPSYLDNSPNVVYECIEDRISFLASRAGGTGELVADDDKASALFDPNPDSLAEALRPLVTSRRKPPPPRASYDGVTSLAAWRPLLAPASRPNRETSLDDAGEEPAPVSVIVAHFNQPTLIWDTLRSLDDQDHPADLEIIVVDDGSTDPTAIRNLADIEAHPWKRPLTVIRQENQYLGAARNNGVRHARYELVAFVDDDDTVEPTYVRWMATAQQRFDADAVTVAIHSIKADEDGTIADAAEEAVWAFLGDAPALATAFNTVGGAAALFRRTALQEVGGFHERPDVGHEDWNVLVRLALAGRRLVSLPEAPYHYRVRPQSMLRTTPTWTNMQPVFESYREHLPPELRVWPELVRGQQDLIDRLRAEVGSIEAERHRVATLLDERERYLRVLRRTASKAKAGLRALASP